jgi:recombination protein RecA
VRCGGELNSALRAADLLLQAGGFGTVVLDLGAAPVSQLHRIQGSFWHRFRLAVESTPTIFLILCREGLASCSSLRLQARQIKKLWTGERDMSLFRGLTFEFSSIKPPRIGAVAISARPHLT